MADVTDPTQGFKAHITPDKASGLDEFDATIAYYGPAHPPPGEQPPTEPPPPPPIVIMPPDPEVPTPDPIPEPPPPPQPEHPENYSQPILVWTSKKTWLWILIPRPKYELPGFPDEGPMKGKRR